MPYRQTSGCKPLIQGEIDRLTPGGIIQGWVRHTQFAAACHVQVTYAGALVAEATARLFRRDVLAAGTSHGHHGFDARLLRPLPQGNLIVLLCLPEHDATAPMQVDVPPLDPPVRQRVEDMLRHPPGWTAADVGAHPECLGLDSNFAQLGPARYTDAVFRFVFSRWPSKAESRMNAASLAAGRITPTQLLLECLASRERADMRQELPGPFDPAFPFHLTAPSPTSQARTT